MEVHVGADFFQLLSLEPTVCDSALYKILEIQDHTAPGSANYSQLKLVTCPNPLPQTVLPQITSGLNTIIRPSPLPHHSIIIQDLKTGASGDL